MLEGSSLMLRPIRRSDIPAFLVWYNDMEVLQYLGQNLLKSEMDEEKYVEELTGDATRINLVIETRDTGSPRAIGNVGFEMINYRDRQATFGIAIGEKTAGTKVMVLKPPGCC
jgi:RimJ/RimL family protein N-acetyltransferase